MNNYINKGSCWYIYIIHTAVTLDYYRGGGGGRLLHKEERDRKVSNIDHRKSEKRVVVANAFSTL